MSACRFCGRPAERVLHLVDGPHIRGVIPYCNAHAACMALGEWTLTLKCMDSTSAVRGVPSHHADGVSL